MLNADVDFLVLRVLDVLGQGQGLVVIEGVGVGTVVRVASQIPVSNSGGAPSGSALSKDSQS